MSQQMWSFLWDVRSHKARFISSLILGKMLPRFYHQNAQQLSAIYSFPPPPSVLLCSSQHWLEPNKPVVRQMKCKCHACSRFCVFVVSRCNLCASLNSNCRRCVWVCAVFALLQCFFSTLIFNASRVASGKTRLFCAVCSGGITVGKIKIQILFIVTCQHH